MKRYIYNLLISLSQVANVLLAGDPDETLSSRAGKKHPRLAKIIDKFMWFDPKHCASSVEPDEGSRALGKRDRYDLIFFVVGALAVLALFLLYV